MSRFLWCPVKEKGPQCSSMDVPDSGSVRLICELARHVIHVKTYLIFFAFEHIHRIELNGIGQQLNNYMELHMLRCILQLFLWYTWFQFSTMKLSNPKGKWTLFMKKHQLQLLGGSFNGIWMDASGQYFEHFAPKNTGFPVGCTPNKKSHM